MSDIHISYTAFVLASAMNEMAVIRSLMPPVLAKPILDKNIDIAVVIIEMTRVCGIRDQVLSVLRAKSPECWKEVCRVIPAYDKHADDILEKEMQGVVTDTKEAQEALQKIFGK